MAATAHLQGAKHGDHAGDERNDEEPRVDGRHEERTPKADQHRAEETEVASEQNRENERSQRVGNKHRHELHIDASRVGENEQSFDQSELREQDRVNQREAGIAIKGLRVVDPELRDGDREDEETNEEFGFRCVLRDEVQRRGRRAAEDKERETQGEGDEDGDTREPTSREGFTQRALLDRET